MLSKLLSAMDRNNFTCEVVSLTGRGEVADKIEQSGIPVTTLGMRAGLPDPRGILRLARHLKSRKADVVQTWMYHADLIGGIAGRLAGRLPLAWNIRHSDFKPGEFRRTTLLTVSACARLSRSLPTRIICCAEAARTTHIAFGYDASKMIVIPNGFDLSAFHADTTAYQSVRRELNLPETVRLIGLAGRFHPQKDHPGFIRAAGLLVRRFSEVSNAPHFVLCGGDVTPQNATLQSAIAETGVPEQFHLLGRRDDIPRLMAGFDVYCSSSSNGEGFPNVVGEAMACGVPCVVTDVGDSAVVVGETGLVVPPEQPDTLAEALYRLLSEAGLERVRRTQAARKRVEENFALPLIARRYENLYREMGAL